MKKILIAIDDSSYSMKAAKVGFSLAHSLKASLGIVYVVDKTKEINNPDLGITMEESKTILLKEVEKTIEQYMDMYKEVHKIFRFSPEGFPEKEILNVAEQWGAELIVMGTHGRTGLQHLLMGSVAENIVRHSKIPVMVVPSK